MKKNTCIHTRFASSASMLKLLLLLALADFCIALSISLWSESEKVSMHMLGVKDLVGDSNREKQNIIFFLTSVKSLIQTWLQIKLYATILKLQRP